ncbi:MAG TPA: sulfatase [Acidobacteriaceae bacterium]|nr:sulfatase [Acidobacteriaceae bacterium]
MSGGRDGITRREAMARIGGAVVGSAMAGPLLTERAAAEPAALPRKGGGNGKRPNILWITAEGIPLKALGCYGSKLIETPHIDRIAKEGMRCTNSFTTNALCAPSRATLLTGKYDHLNGMLSNPGGTTSGVTASTTSFDPKQETVAKVLKQNGYQTGIVGKWHLPANPGEVGFDYFVFKRGAGGPYYRAEGYLRNPSLGSTVIEEKSYPGYITDNVVDFTIEGIKQFTEPFCMMVQFFNDHRPFDPPHKYEHIYDDVRIPEPGTFYDDYSLRASAAREARMRIADMPDFDPPKDLTERQRKQWNYQKFMEHFLGTLRAQDDAVGRLLDYLDKSGLAENTIVVYTADHGFFLGDHGWFDKRFMYEQAIRVPWMIRYPGQVKAGSVSDDWVVNIDNAPTMLDMVGLEVPAEMQGRSVAPLWKGTTPTDWPKSYYYHYYEFGPPHWVLPHYGIRTERYKLINYYTVNEWELFDLEKDPDEMESLFEWSGYKVHPGYEAVAQDLVGQLKALREKYKDTTGKPVHMWPTQTYD